MGLEQNDYTKHQDNVSNWYNQAGLLRDDANTAYDREHSDWQTGNSQAWDEYITGVNQKFTASENEKSRNFTASENDKDRDYQKEQDAKAEKEANYTKLANKITSYGYEPTKEEREAVGMSEEDAKYLKGAYDSANAPKYKDLNVGDTAYDSITTEVKRATTLTDLLALKDKYLALGYNPDQIDELTAYKAQEFLKNAKQGNTVPTVGGGGNGGVIYARPW